MSRLAKSRTFLITVSAVVLTLTNLHVCLANPNAEQIPNLVGTWKGENKTYSEKKGYSSWNKTIVISEQKNRIFKGQFTYADGTKHFFGVIYPDNTSFTWVSSDGHGYNHGRIHSTGNISACYTESGADATVGCVELTKNSQ